MYKMYPCREKRVVAFPIASYSMLDSHLQTESKGASRKAVHAVPILKVHKIEIFFGFDFEICIISLLIMSNYLDFTKKFF